MKTAMNLKSASVQNALAGESAEKNAWIDIYKACSSETARELGLRFRSFNSAASVLTASADTLALNKVLGFESPKDINENILTEIIDFYRKNKVKRFFLQVHPDLLSGETTTLLNLSGFNFYNNWAKLFRDAFEVKEIKSSIIVEQIGKQGGKHFAEILIKSFEWDQKLKNWLFDFVQRDNWIHYLGYYGNNPVAAASLFLDGEYAWLGFAATLKDFRKLGAQHALIRQRLLDGLNNGVKHFIVETAENTHEKKSQSFLNLMDMGFEPSYLRPNFIFNFSKE